MNPHVQRACRELEALGFKDLATPRDKLAGKRRYRHPHCPDDDDIYVADYFSRRRCDMVVDEGRNMLKLLPKRMVDMWELERLMKRPPGC